MIVKKLTFYLLTFLLLLSATFFMMKSIPGDPFSDEKAMPKEAYEAAFKYYGLDKPLLMQLANYIGGILTFDFGVSIYYPGKNINDLIKQAFPISLILGLEALCFSVAGGVLFGCLAAIFASKTVDKLVLAMTCLLVSLPSFAAALILQYVFSVNLGWLPIARFSSFSHTILPVLALSLLPIAYLARLIRANILEVKELPFVKTAISKGLSPFRVALMHILPSALMPAVGYLGQLTASIIVGSFVIEKIFAIPGIGGALVKSVLARDYPAIMGLTAFFAYILFACIFLSDLLTYILDPRLRRTR